MEKFLTFNLLPLTSHRKAVRGQGMTEYILIVFLIAILAYVAVILCTIDYLSCFWFLPIPNKTITLMNGHNNIRNSRFKKKRCRSLFETRSYQLAEIAAVLYSPS